ncbi:MAG: hypothetical protein U1E37_02775 [Sphingomonadaceae bacterium]
MIDQFQPDLSTEFVATVDDAGLSTIASIARAVLCARTDPIAAKFKEALERAPLHAVEGIEAELSAEQGRRMDDLFDNLAALAAER